MVALELDDAIYKDLIQILNEKFYSTTDLLELTKINNLYKALKFQSESWLSHLDSQKLLK